MENVAFAVKVTFIVLLYIWVSTADYAETRKAECEFHGLEYNWLKDRCE